MKKKVLITGAAGKIGKKLIKGLSRNYDLWLMDKKGEENNSIISADLSSYDRSWVEYFQDVDTVLHLAANPDENASWEELITDNIDCLLSVCQAAAEKKVKRLVFASSCHTMGAYMHSDQQLITADMPPNSDRPYGVSKIIGERICRSFQARFPISVVCLRIGWVPRQEIKPKIKDDLLRSLWLGDLDLVQIFEKSIQAWDIGFQILFAMSDNYAMRWDLETTRKVLDYHPEQGIGPEDS